jgi:hypothetical protein
MACWMYLEGFQVVSSHFWALVCTSLTGQGHLSDRSECCPVYMLGTGLTGGGTGLTGQSLADAAALFSSSGLHAFVQGELHWFRGSLHLCRGSSLWSFELWFGGLRSLLELSFVSDVSSRCPCLRGPRLVFFN